MNFEFPTGPPGHWWVGGNSKLEVEDFEDRIGFALSGIFRQPGNRAPEHRMYPTRCDLVGRFEGKAPGVKARVGNFESRPSAYQIPCEKEVEIQRSGPPVLFPRPIPTGRAFEVPTACVEIMGTGRPLDQDGSVEEVGLRRSDRARSPQPRNRRDGPAHREGGQTVGKQPLRVAVIAAETEEYAKHRPG